MDSKDKAGNRPSIRDEMSKEEFDAMMAAGLAQAKEGRSFPVDVAFSGLLEKLSGEM
ncbi:MAG: hypothetical protein Q4C40_01040 [Eubacteriales bacterium]|nr:hypothetical protein [Eubacteriales bacterium]